MFKKTPQNVLRQLSVIAFVVVEGDEGKGKRRRRRERLKKKMCHI